MKELNEIEVDDKNLHEDKEELLIDYTGELKMIGKLSIGDRLRTTHIRFRNITDYERYINAIDQDYDSDDTIFNGFIYKIDTPQFNLVNRSQYGNGCDFKHENIEYQSKNCFIPTKAYCFVKCINFIAGQHYEQQCLDFIRNEKRRSYNMKRARIQPFCKSNNINMGYFDGIRILPRSVRDRNNALFLYNIHFCLK